KSEPLILRQLEIVKKEIGRSDKIITDLLGYARMRDGKIDEVDVGEILDNALVMVLELQPDHGSDIDIKKIYAKNMPGLWIDPGQLQQVFVNLLTNAVESLEDICRVIQLETQYDRDRKEIVIVIGDRGKGIEKDCQLKMFDSFFTTKKNGTGLGLSIAKSIVETYNGFISIDSERGMGTTLHIRFPVMISRAVQKMRAYHEI
ncbi:GHKL domain-containing protein, partial [PVC group bacterium]|nr:GHKL domain-containing protein [PVC group bacterium]